jgi:hypothetical protein
MGYRPAAAPAARTERLVVRDFGDEAVVYDLDTDQVTHLDAAAAAVWRLCDGTHDFDQLAETTGLPADQTAETLLRLDDAGLLAVRGLSRRDLLRRVGTVVALVPLLSVAAASAAAASSSRTVTVTQVGCTALFISWVTISVSVTGFTPGNVTVAVTYRNWRGLTRQATGVIVANASGSGTTNLELYLEAGATGDQTVTVTASSQVTAGEVTTTTKAVNGC